MVPFDWFGFAFVRFGLKIPRGVPLVAGKTAAFGVRKTHSTAYAAGLLICYRAKADDWTACGRRGRHKSFAFAFVLKVSGSPARIRRKTQPAGETRKPSGQKDKIALSISKNHTQSSKISSRQATSSTLGGNRTAGIFEKRAGNGGRLGRMAAIMSPFAVPPRKDKADTMHGLTHWTGGLFGESHPDPFADHFGIEIIFETK
jgi:hypothetical protein